MTTSTTQESNMMNDHKNHPSLSADRETHGGGVSGASPCCDPICGHCGNPHSAHYFENEVYCYEDTTGDTYTDEPCDDFILGMFTDEQKAEAISRWKSENGHSHNEERTPTHE